MNINNVEFKKINFGDNYYVSKCGIVISVLFDKDNFPKKITRMNHDISNLGYSRVPLKQDAIEKKHLVHRLVYSSWVGFKNKNCIIDHIDSNPRNNNLDNLRECTQKENINFSMISENGKFGANNSRWIIVKELETNKTLEFSSLLDLAIFLGYSKKYSKGLKCTKTKRFKEKYVVLDVK